MSLKLNREVTLVFGKTGSGKTLFSRGFVRGKRRVIVVERWTDKNEYDARRLPELLDIVRFFKTKPAAFRVSYSPRNSDELETLLNIAWVICDVTVVVEEADTYFEKGGRPGRMFQEVVARGRHKEISLVLVSQNPSRMPKDARREADRLVTCLLVDRADREWCCDFPGASPEVDGQIKNLKPLEYLEILASGKITKGRVKI
ncbi:MAG: hypothetical protein PHP45_05945 [Elusimicrobiales bacterium]|nr:hypothetical protein [Elusimicrobiales bacterium]